MLAALLAVAFTSTALAAEPGADEAAKGPAALTGPAMAVAAPAPAPAAPVYGKAEGIIPGAVIGPKFALLPVPAVYGLGLEAKFANFIGVGLDYNAWPTLDFGGSVKAGYNDLALTGRVFPWRGRFFLGAALGQRNFFAKGTEATTGQEVKIEVKSTYLAPEIGWRFVWTSGFFMGIDLGYQIVLSPKTTLTAPGLAVAADPQLKKDVEDAGDQIGRVGLPIISLIQLGFYL
jgi:hypothetical protein